MHKAKYLLVCLFVLLGGCASLTQPKSVNGTVAYTGATLQAVEQTADAELPNMTAEQATKVRSMLVQARAVRDEAVAAAEQGNPSTATSRLQTLASLLDGLQAYLKAHTNGQ